MPTTLVDFAWGTSPAGYAWTTAYTTDGELTPGLYLVEKSVLNGEMYSKKSTNHMIMYPQMYKAFAALQPTEQHFIQFADRYGCLGPPLRQVVIVEMEESKGLTEGESWENWSKAHSEISYAARLWTSVRCRDTQSIWQLLGAKVTGAVVSMDTLFGDSYASYSLESDGPDPERVALISQGILDPKVRNMVITRDVAAIGRAFLASQVNDALNHMVQPKLLWDLGRKKQRIHIVPCGLLGAMWLQLALAMTKGRKDPCCQSCGEYFMACRSDAKYCSPACRMQAYRRRAAALQTPQPTP